jgi:hypothetical protein
MRTPEQALAKLTAAYADCGTNEEFLREWLAWVTRHGKPGTAEAILRAVYARRPGTLDDVLSDRRSRAPGSPPPTSP